jgi:hypothetical protein
MEKITKKIRGVSTSIANKVQMVILHFEKDTYTVSMPFSAILKIFPDCSITSVECLVGLQFNELIFRKGEKMPDGTFLDIPFCKKYKIDPMSGLKPTNYLENIGLYRSFLQIEKVEFFPKKNQQKAYYKIFIENGARFIPEFLFSRLTGLSVGEFHLLEGSFITTETWNEGEYILSDETEPVLVKKSGLILKNPLIRTSPDYLTSYNDYLKLKASILLLRKYTRHRKGANDDDMYLQDIDPIVGEFTNDIDDDKYWQYGGPLDGYGNAMDDNYINDVFGGEPGASSNIE